MIFKKQLLEELSMLQLLVNEHDDRLELIEKEIKKLKKDLNGSTKQSKTVASRKRA